MLLALAHRASWLAFVAPAALALPAGAQESAAQLARASSQVLHARIVSVLREAVEEQELVGLAAGLIEGGSFTRELHFGHADREGGVAVGEGTLFRWASISKPLTAVACRGQ